LKEETKTYKKTLSVFLLVAHKPLLSRPTNQGF
jgi:hypothetical protein